MHPGLGAAEHPECREPERRFPVSMRYRLGRQQAEGADVLKASVSLVS